MMLNASLGSWHAGRPMTHCVVITICLGWLLLLRHVRADEGDDLCTIRATLYVTPPEQRNEQDFGLQLDIDCTAGGNSSLASRGAEAAFDLGAQRVAGRLHVLLNGSQTPPLGVASYGLEYLDNCAQLQSIQIEHFVGDTSLALSCDGNHMESMHDVSLRDNELGTLSGSSFALLPHMKKLLLENNSLRLLETFVGCDQLEQLVFRRERQLALRQVELLAHLHKLQRLEITQLKLIQAELLEALPGELTELLVQQTIIEPHRLSIRNGSDHLVNLTLVQCDLIAFSLVHTTTSKLLHLNLSGNALKHFELNNSALLVSLDLSANQLISLNSSWFAEMPHLQVLHLRSNELHRISLLQLLQLAPLSLVQLDLSSNQLLSLEGTAQADWDPRQPLHIKIDDNPWSCQWLLNFSHTQPQLFRLFKYAKYISQINVNGLSCKPQLEEPIAAVQEMESSSNQSAQLSKPSGKSHLNVSSHTVLFGNPLHQSHSQRSEALILVFMLPVGIALLFLLLYLYLHCERLFHWSYYSHNLPCFGNSKSARAHRFIDHIDIVRYPMTNGNGTATDSMAMESQPDGYETPMTGAPSICNCVGHRESTCSRTHHVTYETMPNELPYQLYTEIKEPPEADEKDRMPAEVAIYDHLSFEEEKPIEV